LTEIGFKRKLTAILSFDIKEISRLMKNIALLILICLAPFPITTSVATQEVKHVYIAASYEKNHICGGPQEEGIIKGLNKTGWFEGMNLRIKRYYMDTKRKNTTPKAMKEEANIVFRQIQEFNPESQV
jgi:hypothetical protein